MESMPIFPKEPPLRMPSSGEPVPRYFFTTVELASMLRAHPKTLLRWRLRGTGPDWIMREGRVIYPADAVERYLFEQTGAMRTEQSA